MTLRGSWTLVLALTTAEARRIMMTNAVKFTRQYTNLNQLHSRTGVDRCLGKVVLMILDQWYSPGGIPGMLLGVIDLMDFGGHAL